MWRIDFYEKADGTAPAEEFLDSIKDAKLKAKMLRQLDLLEEFGNELREPHTKPIKDERGSLFELRTRSANNIARVFFFFVKGKTIVLLNGFVKKTERTPRKEIDKAFSYKADYLRKE